MPEGPSIVILREAADRFAGHTVVEVSGNSKVDKERLRGQREKRGQIELTRVSFVFRGDLINRRGSPTHLLALLAD
jgi:hypothetical protein